MSLTDYIIVTLLSIGVIAGIIYSIVSTNKDFNDIADEYNKYCAEKAREEKEREEMIENLLWCNTREVAEYSQITIPRAACILKNLEHKGLIDRKKGLMGVNEHKPREVMYYKSLVENKNIRDLVKDFAYDYQVQKPKIAIKNSSLIPLTCSCCGGKINRINLTCEFCGIEYMVGG